MLLPGSSGDGAMRRRARVRELRPAAAAGRRGCRGGGRSRSSEAAKTAARSGRGDAAGGPHGGRLQGRSRSATSSHRRKRLLRATSSTARGPTSPGRASATRPPRGRPRGRPEGSSRNGPPPSTPGPHRPPPPPSPQCRSTGRSGKSSPTAHTWSAAGPSLTGYAAGPAISRSPPGSPRSIPSSAARRVDGSDDPAGQDRHPLARLPPVLDPRPVADVERLDLVALRPCR